MKTQFIKLKGFFLLGSTFYVELDWLRENKTDLTGIWTKDFDADTIFFSLWPRLQKPLAIPSMKNLFKNYFFEVRLHYATYCLRSQCLVRCLYLEFRAKRIVIFGLKSCYVVLVTRLKLSLCGVHCNRLVFTNFHIIRNFLGEKTQKNSFFYNVMWRS